MESRARERRLVVSSNYLETIRTGRHLEIQMNQILKLSSSISGVIVRLFFPRRRYSISSNYPETIRTHRDLEIQMNQILKLSSSISGVIVRTIFPRRRYSISSNYPETIRARTATSVIGKDKFPNSPGHPRRRQSGEETQRPRSQERFVR